MSLIQAITNGLPRDHAVLVAFNFGKSVGYVVGATHASKMEPPAALVPFIAGVLFSGALLLWVGIFRGC